MTSEQTIMFLKVASAIVIAFGLIVALAAYPATAGLAGFLIDLIYWPVDGAQNLTNLSTRFICAVSGGIMVGWGVLLWLITTRLYPHDPELARTLILWSIGTWFVVDSLGSFVVGAPLNAALNLLFVFAFYWPLRHTNEQALEA